MIMCIQNLVLIGLFVFKILSKTSILTLIKGSNSVSNLPKFELSVTCIGVRFSVMFHFMFAHYTFSSVWVVEWPPFGK